ncbi:neprosin family prolyl endopeptidase [Xanthomonas cannabis]|uniref:neprosin family prolyl endopeptidase n=1 Tax=Xanthomonas cannabis TaxID=1885674 RepID=UPI00141B2790|nr:neprosin family prolyl endopeptidase [Xanthomonas cannabis]NIK17987.1 hypothetical protein [Xanthomonas cannabis]
MTFYPSRPMLIGRTIAALVVCSLAPAGVASTLVPPSISPARDRSIDALMPPLSHIPATVSVTDAHADAVHHSSAAASRAFPQVTAEFKQFLNAQAHITYATHSATAKVADPIAFAEMQRYLFNRYNGLTVISSLHDGTQVFDCIPQAQQPGLRNGDHIAPPPSIAPAKTPRDSDPAALRCAAGTIPLQRVGMAELIRHADLNAFLHANARPVSAAPTAAAPAAASDGHAYSIVYLDTAGSAVTGAGADLNLWAPALRSADETQTISQIWIAGESASKQTQTLEVGWEAQPAGWGDKPIIFIYSTQDGYVRTGCHNLDCSDFVQTSTKHVLGAQPAAGFSTAGGKQTMLSVEFQRNTDGNWWLRLDGEWIGYYKAALYSGDFANGRVAYLSAGGEVSTDSGAISPRMGSGQFATAGYRQAAFQANHFYRDAAMATHPVQRLSSLRVEHPSCYTLALAGYTYPYALGSGVSRTSLSPEMQNGGFYFGGPGCAP